MRIWVCIWASPHPLQLASPQGELFSRPLASPSLSGGLGAGAGLGESQLHIRTGILRRLRLRRRRAGPSGLRTARESSPHRFSGEEGEAAKKSGSAGPSVTTAPTQDPYFLPGSPSHLPPVLAPFLAPRLLILSTFCCVCVSFFFFLPPLNVGQSVLLLWTPQAPEKLHLWLNYLSLSSLSP